jgi:DNA-directed RNA polymerase specialized sigma24 family protein
MLLEVDSAYWKLSKEDRKLLFFRHAESLDFKEIANFLSLGTEDAARMRHKRAIKRLVNKLGGYKPYYDEDFTDATETNETPESPDQESDM